jgi:hypothetical protein
MPPKKKRVKRAAKTETGGNGLSEEASKCLMQMSRSCIEDFVLANAGAGASILRM